MKIIIVCLCGFLKIKFADIWLISLQHIRYVIDEYRHFHITCLVKMCFVYADRYSKQAESFSTMYSAQYIPGSMKCLAHPPDNYIK